MKLKKTIWGSVGLLVGVVVAILAFVRGPLLLPLLIAAFAIWGLWPLWTQVLPFRRTMQLRKQKAQAENLNRYRRIDNIDIAKITLLIIEKMPGVIYESCNLSPDYMYIKVVNPRLTAEVSPGDIVQAGVVISNSETGQGAVCVQPLILWSTAAWS